MALDFRMLTAKEVASILAVSEKTIWRWAADGIIPSFRQGRTVRFVEGDVEAFILRQKGAKHNGVADSK